MPQGGLAMRPSRVPAAALSALLMTLMLPGTAAAAPTETAPPAVPPPTRCLETGDGYFRAHVAGAIEARIDWPNAGTKCQGESKTEPAGVRMSFQRTAPPKPAPARSPSAPAPDLLFVFGLTGVREGRAARAAGANLTLIVQGTPKIFGTLGDSRCTVDSLTQRPLPSPGAYRVEARGFCTQPARAVHGTGDVLVSTFEFAGLVNYGAAFRGAASAVAGPAALK
jgi:hypothetical protein